MKKLALHKETLRQLNEDALKAVHGGVNTRVTLCLHNTKICIP